MVDAIGFTAKDEANNQFMPAVPPGVRLLRTLKGHDDWIGRIAWSTDGRFLASPSEDKSIRLWDFESGTCIKTLKGHTDTVVAVSFDPSSSVVASASDDKSVRLWNSDSGALLRAIKGHSNWVKSVAFAPANRVLATGSSDRSVKLWDATSGKQLRSMEGHASAVTCVAFDTTGRMLASASADKTAILWDAATGRRLRTLKGHSDGISGLAFDPAGRMLATASIDKSVKLWNVSSGRLLRTLEGHTYGVKHVAFSPDGRLLASKCDETVHLWRCDTGAWVATIPEPASSYSPPGLAFHPSRSLLASVGSDPGTPEDNPNHDRTLRDRIIHLWELDFDRLLGEASAPPVAYASSKIVLVGDSGVGKTGLGWCLAHGEFKEHASTHGQQFWVLNELSGLRTDGTQCEAVLWDLAGQPDYRLIHALFLDDSDLVLVLFDPTDSCDPFHGVEFWLKQLQVDQSLLEQECGSRNGPPILLVAARSDRGTATLTREELEAFCQQRKIGGYLSTSSKTGEGVSALIEQMKAMIPWEDKPATVTTATFKRIKDYVLELKENQLRRRVVLSPLELRRELENHDELWQFTDAEMLTAVGHLENHGYVKRLRTSRGETRILLAPELVNNLAASFVLEARRNPKGLGSLEEQRLVAGKYSFSELEDLEESEREILLDSAALLFLEHNVCFRETSPLTSTSYLVFPDLINLKRPNIEDRTSTQDGVSYTIGGAVENVYASLVVLLGYTQTFTRTDQWRNHARYEVGDGLVCGFRQDAERDGELDFVLFFGTDVGAPIRTLFQSLFESFLGRRNLTVFRYEPVACANSHSLSREVVRERLRDKADFAFCPKCGAKTSLPKADEAIQLSRQEQAELELQHCVADLRSRFEQVVFRVNNFVKVRGIKPPECFISYAWGDAKEERWVERQLATDLKKAGIDVLLDRWDNAKIGASVARFVERVATSDRVVVVGTPRYRHKYDNQEPMGGFVVSAEGDLIGKRMLETESRKASVMPCLLAGNAEEAFPPLLNGRVCADFRDPAGYFMTAFDLILSIYDIAPGDSAVADLREMLRGDAR